jgi:hypothetical protein
MTMQLNVCQITAFEDELLRRAERAADKGDFERACRIVDRYMSFHDRLAARNTHYQ